MASRGGIIMHIMDNTNNGCMSSYNPPRKKRLKLCAGMQIIYMNAYIIIYIPEIAETLTTFTAVLTRKNAKMKAI